jgi:hypothetical protein
MLFETGKARGELVEQLADSGAVDLDDIGLVGVGTEWSRDMDSY